MEFKELMQRAKQVREQYAALERETYGKEWTREQLVQGFVGDVGDLVKFAMAKEGLRTIPEADRKLAHELAECLWSILIIADQYGIDLEDAFLWTMKEVEEKIGRKASHPAADL